ncbi:Outer membrane protein OmpA [Cyclobacterium lianum]|uniref:Outer membrane protein OmpA n=1 Tax=Cyclobacterium lianum TaxID=388280 RepID=A0A1M7QKD3_9BACT|nr:OmpA family protein [Cyclobacterium lianum]SHN31613.1 Outer membrane protein OmpA [Cyclobacterium lianum]
MKLSPGLIGKASVILALACCYALPLPAQVDVSKVHQVFSLDYDEQQPLIGPDGRLFFSLAYHPQNNGGEEDPGDIWVGEEKADSFGTPVRIPELSTPHHDLLIGFIHPDTLLVYHQNFQNQQAVYSYFRAGSEWQRGEAQVFPGFKVNGSRFSARLDASGSIMILSMDSFGSYGNEDIYVSFRQGNSWSRPLNLGSGINTAMQELSPFLSADGRRLYYSTNAGGGSKPMAVYFSRRIGAGWRQWSTPSRLDLAPMEGFDLFYTPDPANDRAFFTNTHTSDGYGEILMLGEFKPEAIIEPGIAPLSQPPGEADTAGERVPEIAATTEPAEAAPEIRTSFEALNAGGSVILDRLLFRRGSTALADSSGMAQLEDLAAFLSARPETHISVEGHTDNYGSARLNERLSLDRARKVRELLLDMGVAEDKIRVNGWGGSRPIAPNNTAGGRAKNRRVEIKVLDQ